MSLCAGNISCTCTVCIVSVCRVCTRGVHAALNSVGLSAWCNGDTLAKVLLGYFNSTNVVEEV